MIVFSAFLPHTPLLTETVGKEHRKKLKKTVAAVQKLAEGLVSATPDTLVVISAHPTRHADAFSINLHEPYRTDLSRFGDMGAERTYKPDISLIDTTQRTLRRQGIPLTLDTDHALDHGATVPLLLLAKQLPRLRVMPITYAGLDAKSHVEFGRALKEVFAASKTRIAVIASGDLSHALTKTSPEGERPEGKKFDAAVKHAVESMGLSQLLGLDPVLVEAAAECAYRPLLVLLGLLEKTAVDPEVLSYEAPFGVGLLTARFHLD